MNIFVLDRDPEVAALMHCDQHVIKMPVESAQMLSEGHHVLDNATHDGLCDPFNPKHPCSLWSYTSRSNYLWLFTLFEALSKEYEYRYGRVHDVYLNRREALATPPKNLPDIGLTPFAQAMPESYKCEDAVEAYHIYYLCDKPFAKWTRRPPPDWWPDRTVLPDTLRQKRLKALSSRTISIPMKRLPSMAKKTKPTVWKMDVDSSTIEKVAYNVDKSKLLVTFKNGGKYVYDDVTLEEFTLFSTADSKGSWFANNIKGIKEFRKRS